MTHDTYTADRLLALLSGGGVPVEQRCFFYGAAYEAVYPIVFRTITRRVEHGRGHTRCARSLRHLEDACLDGFYDDVEAVVERLLAATAPIDDLQLWVARCAAGAAIDGHRRRRTERGALQRPRMTKALETALPEPWLRELAIKILVWVGLPVGTEALWPLDTWAHARAAATGDQRGSTPSRVAADIERVLARMRERPDWYAAYVERPLGSKVTPARGAPGDGPRDPRPLTAAEPDEIDRARIADLASVAVEAIRAGLGRGEEPRTVVVRVLSALFVDGTGSDGMDRVPLGAPDAEERMSALLRDGVALSVLVERVLAIVG
ncbi:MAG TPA: hypothetical protein VGD29_29940 [Actinoplanes sp.]